MACAFGHTLDATDLWFPVLVNHPGVILLSSMSLQGSIAILIDHALLSCWSSFKTGNSKKRKNKNNKKKNKKSKKIDEAKPEEKQWNLEN